MTPYTQKAVRQLQPGDVVLNEGEMLTVAKTGRGFWPGAVLIDWKEKVKPQWSCLHGAEHVAVRNKE
jgi:hypothetical protein